MSEVRSISFLCLVILRDLVAILDLNLDHDLNLYLQSTSEELLEVYPPIGTMPLDQVRAPLFAA